jgi:hypothetical protein
VAGRLTGRACHGLGQPYLGMHKELTALAA